MTTLSFPNPPGGMLTCPVSASPIINQDPVTDEITAECYLPPSGGGLLATKNGILSKILDENRPSDRELTYLEEDILASGTYYHPTLGLFLFKVAGLEMEQGAS